MAKKLDIVLSFSGFRCILPTTSPTVGVLTGYPDSGCREVPIAEAIDSVRHGVGMAPVS